MEETNMVADPRPKRPVFLTALCLLSFIGIAFCIIDETRDYIGYVKLANSADSFKVASQKANTIISDVSDLFFDYNKMAKGTLIQIVLNFPVLAGVLLMWKQKRIGYYIYAAFEIVHPAVPLFLGYGLLSGYESVFYVVLSFLFVMLYGSNLKQMS